MNLAAEQRERQEAQRQREKELAAVKVGAAAALGAARQPGAVACIGCCTAVLVLCFAGLVGDYSLTPARCLRRLPRRTSS